MIMNLDFVYPIGSIYLSINSTNPSKWFGGTWQQITSDAYLKIVTSNAGSLSGTTTDHKIPIESMPSHEHIIRNNYGYIDSSANTGTGYWGQKLSYTASGGTAVSSGYYRAIATGGGQAYYPYYYGVYVWKRTA